MTLFAGTPAAQGFADGVGSLARFNSPTNIVVDWTGTFALIVSLHIFSVPGIFFHMVCFHEQVDQLNHAIRYAVLSSATITTLAGNGASGSADGVGSSATFYWPWGVALDRTGSYAAIVSACASDLTSLICIAPYLSQADSTNQLIRKIVVSSRVVTTIAGQAGTSGRADGVGTNAVFNRPTGITVDGSFTFALVVS